MVGLQARFKGYTMPVLVDEQGHLICRCCGEPMVEVASGTFMCGLSLAIEARIREALA